MKKLLAISALALFVFSSCKKDYTCDCTATSTGDENWKIEYKKVKKKDAQAACDLINTLYQGYAKCELK